MRIVSLIIVLAIFIGGIGFFFYPNTYAQAICTETSGRTERPSYYAGTIQTNMVYTIYLPPCYDQTTKNYPVIYLMHGSNDDDNHWIRLGLQTYLDESISSGNIPPMIVVLPFGNWIANENRFGFDSWGAVFLDQLMPLAESSYRIDARKETRAIGGISRGGFWAYQIGLRRPDLFSAIGGHSAFFDRFHAPPEANPLDLALSAPNIETMRLWLDRGANDYAAPGLDIMDERLSQRGIPYTYIIHPEGEHNNTYWSAHVAEYIQFYADSLVFSQSPDATPSLDLGILPPQPALFVTNTPRSPEPTPIDSSGMALFLPVVAFPSIQSSIENSRLVTIQSGLLDNNFVVSDAVANQLVALGVELPIGTTIIPADRLYNTLWRDTGKFTLLPFDQITPRYRVLMVDELHPLDQLDRYPFAFWDGGTPNFYPSRLTRVLMTGVTALTRDTTIALDKNGTDWAVSAILPYTQNADFFHISNEVSFVADCPRVGMSTFNFCSKPAHFDILTALDVDIVELSGNHNNDYGYEAYIETLNWYAENGMSVIGGGRTLSEAQTPYIFEHNDNQIGMIACNWVGPYYAFVNENPSLTGGVRPGAAECNRTWLAEAIPQLAGAVDVVIVTVQYLELDQYQPSNQQRADFRWLAELGADVVIGTQAHFPQTIEFFPQDATQEAFIHYGLGNFFFDQEFFAGKRAFLNQLFIYDGRLQFVDLYPILIEGQGQPRPMTADERLNFLHLLLIQNGSFSP
ncbi:MAG: CapA family protein [Anaerolineae bacterium]|nr:CapA family protein [Anaerolineae bacterium]